QRTHRTDVYDVGRIGILERSASVNAHLRLVSAIENAELASLSDFIRKAHAAGAEDTALLIQHYMGPECHGFMLLDLLLLEPRIVESEVQVEVLQIALAGLITNGTIKWMFCEEELQHCAPAVLSLGTFGVHYHPFHHGRVTGNLEFGRLLYIHKADAAVARDRQCGVIAITWNKNPEFLCGLNAGASVGHADLTA